MENGPVLASERSNNSLARQFNKSRSLRAMGRAVLNDFSQAKARQKWHEQPFDQRRLRFQLERATSMTNPTHATGLSVMREDHLVTFRSARAFHERDVSGPKIFAQSGQRRIAASFKSLAC